MSRALEGMLLRNTNELVSCPHTVTDGLESMSSQMCPERPTSAEAFHGLPQPPGLLWGARRQRPAPCPRGGGGRRSASTGASQPSRPVPHRPSLSALPPAQSALTK